MRRLTASLHENANSNAAMEEFLGEPAALGIRWALPGGMQRTELTIRARSRLDAYERYRNHQGKRVMIHDQGFYRPVTGGWIYEVVPNGRHVTYVIAGGWQRHFDDYYRLSDFPGTGNTDAIIKDILTDRVPVVSSNQANIAATSTAIGGWSPDPVTGTRPGEAIPALALMSNTSDQILDYWLVESPLADGAQKPVAYLQARVTTVTTAADWLIYRRDLAAGGDQSARHIWDLRTAVTIYYDLIASGTHDGAGNNANLVDSTASFVAAGVKVDDTVYNLTDGSQSRVTAVAATQLTLAGLAGGTDNDFDASDRYSVRAKVPVGTSAATESGGETPWSRVWREVQYNMTATQAAQYRDQVLAQYEDSVQQQSFVVGAPEIRGKSGVYYAPWELITRGGGTIWLVDFYPAAGLFATQLDTLQAFRIVAMDYDYNTNLLRIVPDTMDNRLDVLLQNAGLPIGQAVSPGFGTLNPGYFQPPEGR